MGKDYAMKYEEFVLKQLGGTFKGEDAYGVGSSEHWGVENVETQNLKLEAKFGLGASAITLSKLAQNDKQLSSNFADILKRIPTATYAEAHDILDDLIEIQGKISSAK